MGKWGVSGCARSGALPNTCERGAEHSFAHPIQYTEISCNCCQGPRHAESQHNNEWMLAGDSLLPYALLQPNRLKNDAGTESPHIHAHMR